MNENTVITDVKAVETKVVSDVKTDLNKIATIAKTDATKLEVKVKAEEVKVVNEVKAEIPVVKSRLINYGEAEAKKPVTLSLWQVVVIAIVCVIVGHLL